MPRYIDADELKRKALGLGEDVICDDCTYEFINLIDDAPTIEAEPVKRGKWLHDSTGANFCSECGMYPYDDGEYHMVWHTKFCPHCGARMERVE